MTDVIPISIDALRHAGVFPGDTVAAYISGSAAVGWNNELSDYDVYVVTREVPEVAQSFWIRVAANPTRVPAVLTKIGGNRFDIEYWTEGQVTQIVEHAATDSPDVAARRDPNLTLDEVDLVYRLLIAVPVVGAEWLEAQKERLRRSHIREAIAVNHLNTADGRIDDALGQLDAGDSASAVLAAREAFSHVVDAIAAISGDIGPNPKWRARRVMTLEPAVLPWDDYWAIETMQGFDPDSPHKWVLETIDRCRSLMLEVPLE
jgi:hypothetical protein